MRAKVRHVPALGDPGVKPNHPLAHFYHVPEGESFWPQMFPADELKAIKAQIGSALFNAVYNGDPTAVGGSIFKEARWFKPLPPDFTAIRKTLRVVMFVDTAFSEGETGHYTACCTAGADAHNNLYVIGLHQGKWSPATAEEHIIMEWEKHQPAFIVLEKPAFRQQIVKDMARNIRNEIIAAVKEADAVGAKEIRALVPAARAEHGQLFVDMELDDAQVLIQQCLGFPRAKYNDYVDALSGAAGYLSGKLAGFVDLTKMPRQKYVIGGHTKPDDYWKRMDNIARYGKKAAARR